MAETPSVESSSASFDTYDQFLKHAIKDYYDRGWKTRKGNFIALLLASGQTTSMAKDSLTGGKGLQTAAIGAASVVALRIVLAWALTGPLGIVLTGVAAASLIAFFLKNQKEISAKTPRYKTLIAETRGKFEEIQSGYRANRYGARERNLMVDGLLKRFLEECDAA
jgi:hypothetical protein